MSCRQSNSGTRRQSEATFQLGVPEVIDGTQLRDFSGATVTAGETITLALHIACRGNPASHNLHMGCAPIPPPLLSYPRNLYLRQS